MVDGLRLVGVHGQECVGVAGGDRGLHAGCMRGRGIRSHPGQWLRRRFAWRCEWPSFGCEFVEARERLGLMVGGEVLHARYGPLGPEDQEGEELALVAAAPYAFRAEV